MNVLKKHLRPVHLAPWVTTASVKFTVDVSPREDKCAPFPTGGKLRLDMSFPNLITHARKRQQMTSNATDKCMLLKEVVGAEAWPLGVTSSIIPRRVIRIRTICLGTMLLGWVCVRGLSAAP